jgi:[ribosomal protein S5]-alanine N-acetyltransferase
MTNEIIPILRGYKVTLRKPIIQDIEDRLACGNAAEIIRMFGGDTRNMPKFTTEEATNWYERVMSHPLAWIIEFNNKCIGTARLTVTDHDRRARYAVGIHDASKLGIGLGTEVTRLVLEYAFSVLKLHRVDLRTLQYNTRAIACFKKCGFVIEGTEREGALIEDRWETDVIMSILEHEYFNLNKPA